MLCCNLREGFLSPGLMSGHEAIKEWPGGMDVLNALKDVAMSRRPVSASTVSFTTIWITGPLNSLSQTYNNYLEQYFVLGFAGVQNNCV